MVKMLNQNELEQITGGHHNFWWYYGFGEASNISSERRNPTAFLNHPNFIQLGGH